MATELHVWNNIFATEKCFIENKNGLVPLGLRIESSIQKLYKFTLRITDPFLAPCWFLV